MNLQLPNHPIWAIIRTTVILAALVLVLWLNATNFDETEVRTVISMFLAILGAEAIPKMFNK